MVDADFRLLDAEGCVVAEILGFRVKLISGDSAREARENPADLLYDVSWVRKKNPADIGTEESKTSSWFIVADSGGVGQSLAAQLQSRGSVCTLTNSDQLQDFHPAAGTIQVVYLAGLDGADIQSDPKAVTESQARWIAALQFVQTLVRQAQGAKVRLWIVTRGAQPAGSEPGRVALSQTPLWGMAKTIDLEHPGLGCTRIDLDPQGSEQEITALCEELLISGSEREIAYRNGSRYVARLETRAQRNSSTSLMSFPRRRILPPRYHPAGERRQSYSARRLAHRAATRRSAGHWDGATWSPVSMPTAFFCTSPGDVACTSSTDCTAVGIHFPGHGGELTSVEHWDGTTWAVVTSPNPPAASPPGSGLTSVTCTDASNCFAVGWWIRDANTRTLIERFA